MVVPLGCRVICRLPSENDAPHPLSTPPCFPCRSCPRTCTSVFRFVLGWTAARPHVRVHSRGRPGSDITAERLEGKSCQKPFPASDARPKDLQVRHKKIFAFVRVLSWRRDTSVISCFLTDCRVPSTWFLVDDLSAGGQRPRTSQIRTACVARSTTSSSRT